jgi:tetratricopeptide (TPR) repeat protein
MNKFLLLFLIFFIKTYSQDSISSIKVNVQLLKYQITDLQKQVNDNKLHARELQDANNAIVDKLLQEKANAIDARMLIYVSIFIAAFILIFSLFSWLGKSEIRRIINAQSDKIIDDQLKIKLSDKVIDDKLNLLGKPLIENMLEEISTAKSMAKLSVDELESSNEKYKNLLAELSENLKQNATSEPSINEKAKTKEFNEMLEIVKTESQYTQEDWLLKGKEARNIGDLNKAIEYYNEAISLDKNSQLASDGYFWKGLSHHDLKLFKNAVSDFNEALRIEETYASFLMRALSYKDLGELNQALNDAEKAVKIQPDNIAATDLVERIQKAIFERDK